MKTVTMLHIAVVLICLIVLGASADVPNYINFQGTLTDSAGNPISGTLSIVFSIYDLETSGTQLWNETQPSVEINDGLFHVALGSVVPIPTTIFAGESRWLEIEVEGEVLFGRTELTSVPYGFKSNEADHTVYADTTEYSVTGSPDDDWTISGENIYRETGNVGIGVTSPGYRLNVDGDFYANTVNTGQGDNELYGMDQNVRTTDDVTFSTINTGHGANELFPMNQNVRTDANVTFDHSYISDYGYALGGYHVGGTSDPGTDNLIVDGNVGIGASSPSAKLHVQGSTTIHDRFKFSQNGYWADLDLYTGHPSGWPRLYIYETPGSGSRTQTGILNAGVLTFRVLQGITDSNSDDAVGVYGEATTTSSANVFGVKGVSHSTTNNSTGSTAGVYGLNDRTDAVGDVFGVLGEINGEGGAGPEPNFAAGVYGVSYATSGRSAGVWGDSRSSDPNGAGVIGKNASSTGATRGVWGEVSSASGKAVYGRAPSGGYGIWGEEPTGGSGAAIYADGDLIVIGTVGISNYKKLKFNNPSGGTGAEIFTGTDNNLFLDKEGSGNIYLRTQGSSARLTILDGGYVGIGTSGPAYKLDVAGQCHASSFPTSSDERLKTNVEELDNVLDKLEHVRGVKFDWNSTYEAMGRSTGHREIGVIAQELEAQFPELVTTWGDQNYRAVDYGRLTAVLIEAVKELQARVEKLENENRALKEGSR